MNRRSFLADMLKVGVSFVVLPDGNIWNACFESIEAMTVFTLSPTSEKELGKMFYNPFGFSAGDLGWTEDV